MYVPLYLLWNKPTCKRVLQNTMLSFIAQQSGLNEFWELVEPNVEEDEDKVSELNFSLPHVDEPIDQEINRGLQRENNEESVKEKPKAMKSGDSNQKSKSNKNSEVLKTYPKRVSRNKPSKYYGYYIKKK